MHDLKARVKTRAKPKQRAKPHLSMAQREVMEIIWDQGEASVLDVTDRLSKTKSVARNTVRTLMERMEAKGWLTHRNEGRSYIYAATVPREESLGQRVMDMVEKACGGNPEKLMMALLDYRGLSEEEALRIGKMLDEAKHKQGKN